MQNYLEMNYNEVMYSMNEHHKRWVNPKVNKFPVYARSKVEAIVCFNMML